MTTLTKRGTFLAAIVVLAIVFASSALAAGNGSTKSTYSKSGTKIQKTLGATKKKQKSPPKAVTGTTLPFTGLDLVFVVGAGGVLVASGVGLRRVTRKTPSA